MHSPGGRRKAVNGCAAGGPPDPAADVDQHVGLLGSRRPGGIPRYKLLCVTCCVRVLLHQTQPRHRPTRLRALARRLVGGAEGASATAVDPAEATVQLARRVARNPFVPWKAWRKEKYGYSAVSNAYVPAAPEGAGALSASCKFADTAVPTAALPHPSHTLTSLRSIKAHRTPVQHKPRSRSNAYARKAGRTNLKSTPKLACAEVPVAGYMSCPRSTAGGEIAISSPPPSTALSLFSSLLSSPSSATTAASPLSPHFPSRPLSPSAIAAPSRTAVTRRLDALWPGRRPQQVQKRFQEDYARGRYYPTHSCHGCGVARQSASCACASCPHASGCSGALMSAAVETRGRRRRLVDHEQRRKHKRSRDPLCDSLRQFEQLQYWPAAALHNGAAFPPPCSCAGFLQATVASLVSHSEKLEARRLAFSASPKADPRLAVGLSGPAAVAASTQAGECLSDSAESPAAHMQTASNLALPVAPRLVVGRVTVANGRNGLPPSPSAATAPAASAPPDSLEWRAAANSPSEVSYAAVSLPLTASTGPGTSACNSFAADEVQQPRRPTSIYETNDTNNSSVAPSPRAFFIALHSFSCSARRLCGRHLPSNRTLTWGEASGTASRSAVGEPSGRHQLASFTGRPRSGEPLASLSNPAADSSQTTTGTAPTATSLPTRALAEVSDTRPTEVPHCNVEKRSAGAEAIAVLSTQRVATAGHPVRLTPGAPEPAGDDTAPVPMSKTRRSTHKDGSETTKEASCFGGTAEEWHTCSRLCECGCVERLAPPTPVDARRGSAAGHRAQAHDANGEFMPVHAGDNLAETASFAVAGAGHSDASSREHIGDRASEQHTGCEQTFDGFLRRRGLTYTGQKQGGEQQGLPQGHAPSSQPGGECVVGRQDDSCGSAVRRVHTESEGETDDSENGVNCRQKEERRRDSLKLTKLRSHESFHCTLSR